MASTKHGPLENCISVRVNQEILYHLYKTHTGIALSCLKRFFLDQRAI